MEIPTIEQPSGPRTRWPGAGPAATNPIVDANPSADPASADPARSAPPARPAPAAAQRPAAAMSPTVTSAALALLQLAIAQARTADLIAMLASLTSTPNTRENPTPPSQLTQGAESSTPSGNASPTRPAPTTTSPAVGTSGPARPSTSELTQIARQLLADIAATPNAAGSNSIARTTATPALTTPALITDTHLVITASPPIRLSLERYTSIRAHASPEQARIAMTQDLLESAWRNGLPLTVLPTAVSPNGPALSVNHPQAAGSTLLTLILNIPTAAGTADWETAITTTGTASRTGMHIHLNLPNPLNALLTPGDTETTSAQMLGASHRLATALAYAQTQLDAALTGTRPRTSEDPTALIAHAVTAITTNSISSNSQLMPVTVTQTMPLLAMLGLIPMPYQAPASVTTTPARPRTRPAPHHQERPEQQRPDQQPSGQNSSEHQPSGKEHQNPPHTHTQAYAQDPPGDDVHTRQNTYLIVQTSTW